MVKHGSRKHASSLDIIVSLIDDVLREGLVTVANCEEHSCDAVDILETGADQQEFCQNAYVTSSSPLEVVADSSVGDHNMNNSDEADTQMSQCDNNQKDSLDSSEEEEDQVSTSALQHVLSTPISSSVPLSDYERVRMFRIAEIQAEFRRLCPSFEEDVRAVKIPKVKRKPRVAQLCQPTRASSRIRCQKDKSSLEIDINVRSEANLGPSEDMAVECSLETEQGDEEMPESSIECSMETEKSDEDLPESASSNDLSEADVGEKENSGENLGRFGCQPCGLTFR